MTATEVAYANYRENARHNRMTEGIQSTQASAANVQATAAARNARTQAAAQAETARHNQQSELTNWFTASTDRAAKLGQLAETQKQTQISQQNADTARMQAQTQQSELAEAIRHNVATEAEASMHNRISERLSQQQADAATTRATASVIQAGAQGIQAGISGGSQLANAIRGGFSNGGKK